MRYTILTINRYFSIEGNNLTEKKIDLHYISSINKKINSRMILPDLLMSILEVAKTITNSEASSLLLTDINTDNLIFYVALGQKGNQIQGEVVPKGLGIAGTVAETKKAMIVNDAQNDPRLYRDIDIKADFHTRNLLCVPMMVMDEFVGVLEIVNSVGRDGFNSNDLEKATYIAEQSAVAIATRRLYDSLDRRINELTFLYEISHMIAFSGKDENVLEKILRSTAGFMNASRASIIIYDEEEKKLRVEVTYGLPENVTYGYEVNMNNSVSGLVFKTGDPMIVTNILDMPQINFSTEKKYSTNSFISIPIFHKNTSIGVFNISDKTNGEHFDSFELRVLTTVSSQISEYYHNIQNQKKFESQRRLEREIDIAAEIHKKILPVIPASFRDHSLAAFNMPAKEIGGDFYDFFKFDSNKYGVVVADISGKGIPSALFMGSARNIIRAEKRVDYSPSHLLKNANSLLCQDFENGMFVTLFYAVIDTHNNLITYSCAGHNNQLLIRKKDIAAEKLKALGKPLGLFEDIEFEERVSFYEKGDVLVLFTDGVTEALSGGSLDIDIGEKKLIEIIKSNIDSGPGQIIDKVMSRCTAGLGSEDPDFRDDITIFVIKF